MRSFLFSSILCVLFLGCTSSYKSLRAVEPDAACMAKWRPQGLKTAWYNTTIDVIGKHASGLLLIKEMPDASYRVVFTTEGGVTFFDFEFKRDTFLVKKIIPALDRNSVIELFKKDFETLLGIPFLQQNQAWQMGGLNYFGIEKGKEKFFYVTDANCSTLDRLEIAGKRKPSVMIKMDSPVDRSPKKITIEHFNFNMRIELSKFDKIE